MKHFLAIVRPMRCIAFAMSALVVSGCINAPDGAVTDGASKVHSIVLPVPSDAELATLRGGGKGEPLRVGAGRSVPATESKIVLDALPWRKDPSGTYLSTVSIQSVGARSVRAGLRLSADIPTLELSFTGSTATLRGSTIVSTSGKDVYWSPVINGDTINIVLTVRSLPKGSAVLEVPLISHIP